jgi:thioredoxin reductase (NADPH)
LGVPLLAALPHPLRSRIATRAADVRANAGEWLVHDGDPAYFWVLLEGEVEAVKLVAGQPVQVSTFDPGEYFGEVPLMLAAPAFIGVRALRPSRLMRVEAADFHALVTESPEAGSMLAKTLVRRVNFIKDAYSSANLTQATIVGSRYDFTCHDIRDFLSRNQIQFEWLDPSDPADAACIPPEAKDPDARPVVLLPDGTTLREPSNRELAQVLGLQTAPRRTEYDVAIVGGGPAGLAAAVYGGSEGLRTVMIECEAPGGQAGTSSRIENYLGFPGGVSGGDLANRALLQAKRFEAEIVVTRSATEIRQVPGGHVVVLDGGEEVHALSVALATGVVWRKLQSEGAEALVGRGVYYGAARTEALGTRGKDIFLVGGGNSAGQAAMYFSNYARSVSLLVRGPNLERTMSYYLIEQLRTKANITIETGTSVTAVSGNAHIENIVTRREETGEVRERPADGLFVFIGADAETAWLPQALQRDARGYVRTGHDVDAWPLSGRRPYDLETSIPGIFAAGDMRSGSIKRVAAGVGEGSMLIALVHQYLETLQRASLSV